MVHCHTVHLPLGTLLIWCTMCGTGDPNWTTHNLRTESVPVSTLPNVWRWARSAFGSVDILAIDAEGEEGALLREQLPHPPPSLVFFEFTGLSADDDKAVHASLVRQGYRKLAEVRNNYPGRLGHPLANRLYGRERERRGGPA